MCFTSKAWPGVVRIDDVPSYKTWWHVKQLHAKLPTSSVCQCECDISGVANSCLTWTAHGTCGNGRIKSSMYELGSCRHCLTMDGFRYREPSSLFTILSGSWYAPAQPPIGQTRGFAHYQYYYTILIGDPVWCTTESKNEITRRASFPLSGAFRRIYNSPWKITRRIHNLPLWLSSVDRSLPKDL